jgi:hypothetical protein
MGRSTEELELSTQRAMARSVTAPLPRAGGMGASPLEHHQPAPPAIAYELKTVLEAAASSGPRQVLARGQE